MENIARYIYMEDRKKINRTKENIKVRSKIVAIECRKRDATSIFLESPKRIQS